MIAGTALTEASERVRALYGFPCGRAAASLEDIEDDDRRFAVVPGATVVVEGFDPPGTRPRGH